MIGESQLFIIVKIERHNPVDIGLFAQAAAVTISSAMRGRIRLSVLGFTPLVVALAMLLSACGSWGGNASLGPNPGGGFYCPNNAYEGCVNP